ncbi:MAG: hemolysin family protein [Flavobacteriaceae bacterium]|jgi:putative hemolysin|tara:strand:- start:99 stop:1331 length:1233 start_codon:yes stop_codon:yes gene_type:complete
MSEIPIIIISLIFSAFFSGMEIAYVSSNKISIEIEKKKTGFISSIIKILTKKPSKFITTMLIGNNIALVIYGFTMGALLTREFDLNLINQTLVSTFIILITAEFLPKVFFQIYSLKFFKIFILPAYFFYIVFYFVSDFVIWISDIFLKIFFKSKGDNKQMLFSKDELGHYINEQMDAVEKDQEIDSEVQIFQNALDFSELKSRDVMIPRIELVAVEIHDYISNLKSLFISSGYSRILIYKSTIDDVLGYAHSSDLFNKPKTIKSILMPVEFIPEAMLIKDVLNLLTAKRRTIAIVLDEYGGTSGMITIEDIVEELFGEIDDEFDNNELIERKVSDNEYEFSARIEVDYLNENYKLHLPVSEEYETLGGLIVNSTEEIPTIKQEIRVGNFLFKILDVSNTRINLVSLKIDA